MYPLIAYSRYETILIIPFIFAIIITVLSLILITPIKMRERLNGFFKFFHDLFNFRFLLIEKVLKALYIFVTFYIVIFGFCLLFIGDYAEERLLALAYIILGPIVWRLIFEAFMMFILLVKNTNEINNKLGTKSTSNTDNPIQPSSYNPTMTSSVNPTMTAPINPPPVANTTTTFCAQCGARCEQGQVVCPQCGNILK